MSALPQLYRNIGEPCGRMGSAYELEEWAADEIVTLRGKLGAYESVARNLGAMCEGAPNAVALAQVIVALRADAERYRWLREHSQGMPYFSELDLAWNDLDAAIDAAMLSDAAKEPGLQYNGRN